MGPIEYVTSSSRSSFFEPERAKCGDVDSIADSEWHAVRTNRVPMDVLNGYSSAFQSLVVSLMSNDPVSRPSANEVLSICTTVAKEGTSNMRIPPLLNASGSSNSSTTAYDALAELKKDCVSYTKTSHIDTLRSVLHDHRGIIGNVDVSLPSSASFSSSKSVNDIIIDAANAIDRLVFELKTLRREQLDRQHRVDE